MTTFTLRIDGINGEKVTEQAPRKEGQRPWRSLSNVRTGKPEYTFFAEAKDVVNPQSGEVETWDAMFSGHVAVTEAVDGGQQRTHWLKFKCFGALAEALNALIKEGNNVLRWSFQGPTHLEHFKDRQGAQRSVPVVYVYSFNFLDYWRYQPMQIASEFDGNLNNILS